LRTRGRGTVQSVLPDWQGVKKRRWTEKIPQVNYGMHTYAIEDILAVGMQDYLKGKDLDKVLEDAQKQAEEQIK
jgi:hypothetical protein